MAELVEKLNQQEERHNESNARLLELLIARDGDGGLPVQGKWGMVAWTPPTLAVREKNTS